MPNPVPAKHADDADPAYADGGSFGRWFDHNQKVGTHRVAWIWRPHYAVDTPGLTIDQVVDRVAAVVERSGLRREATPRSA